MEQEKSYEKKGYLTDAYRLFYLKDQELREYENHYHDFDKIIIFISGDVEYTIEGKTYSLLSNDIVLVPHGAVHKVTIGKKITYERIVMYLSPSYFSQKGKEQTFLQECFTIAKEQYSYVIRLKKVSHMLAETKEEILKALQKNKCDEYEELYQETLLLQFLIALNREVKPESVLYAENPKCNKKIVEIIRYINEHLTEEIGIDMLAGMFFISKYYLMRQFKEETGYTIGSYINQKRLFLAREQIKAGEPVTQVCFDCGFHEYSSFNRAYKQLFRVTPIKSRGVK